MCDDVFILGPPDRAAAALTRYQELVQADHGRLNLPKSIIWSPTEASTQHPAILALAGVRVAPDAALTDGFDVRSPDRGLRVLGHPLGADDYCRDYYMRQAMIGRVIPGAAGAVPSGAFSATVSGSSLAARARRAGALARAYDLRFPCRKCLSSLPWARPNSP